MNINSEIMKRQHRVCFTGHRPDKLDNIPYVENCLSMAIDQAVSQGFVTFITGMCPGVDVIAGELVLQKKILYPHIHLIAAFPYPRFAYYWPDGWGKRVQDLEARADYVKCVSPRYTGEGVFQIRNKWMVDHARRVIAYYDGSPGGTQNTLRYAWYMGVEYKITNTKDWQTYDTACADLGA